MSDSSLLECWKCEHGWQSDLDPKPLQMAIIDALRTVRDANNDDVAEPSLTDIFFSQLKQGSRKYLSPENPPEDQPVLDGLVFSPTAAKSRTTERETGGDFAIVFWQPDGSLLLAILQAKKASPNGSISISQNSGERGHQVFALLATGMRAANPNDLWEKLSWVHYVSWTKAPWELIQPLSDLGPRLTSIAQGEKAADSNGLLTLPLGIESNRTFFEMLCHGANQSYDAQDRITADWLHLTRNDVLSDDMFKKLVAELHTYFIFNEGLRTHHEDMKLRWLESNSASPLPLADGDSTGHGTRKTAAPPADDSFAALGRVISVNSSDSAMSPNGVLSASAETRALQKTQPEKKARVKPKKRKLT